MPQLHLFRDFVAMSQLHVCGVLRGHVAASRVSSLRGHVAAPRGGVCAVMSQLHVVESAWPCRSFTCVESAWPCSTVTCVESA